MKLKLSVSIIFLIVSLSISAQDKWTKLSPNQKIRIAKKEQKEAKKDPEYNLLMEEAMLLFQSGEYEKAKEKYLEAHNRRPDNVYPMVMLDDVEIALKQTPVKKDEIPVETPPIENLAEDVPVEAPATELPGNIEDTDVEEEIISNKEVKLPVDPEKTPVVVAKPERKAELKTPATQVQKEYKNDGVYRETLKEGSANVNQITIVEKGVSTIYREVIHSWGAKYYFKNKEAITEKEWEKLISDLEKN
jgi:hypothetical protein